SRSFSSAVRTAAVIGSLALLGCSDDNASMPASGMSVPPSPTPVDGGGVAEAQVPPAFDPVPQIAEGPAIPAAGYLVQELKDNLVWFPDGIYSSMFAWRGSGVIVVEAPQTIAPNLLAAIASVTDEPVTHVVYSHHHADHIGGAGVLPKTATFIAQRA